MRRPLRSLLAATAAAWVLAACSAGSVPPETDDQALDRELSTFDGDPTSLRDLTGDPLVVNFWASWCAPCIAEMPDFEEVHRDLGDRVRFVGVNTQDERENALRMVDRTGVTYDLVRDPGGDLFRDLEVFAMPTTYFIDARGVVAHRHSGLATQQQLRDLIAEHLDEDQDAGAT